MIKPDWNIFRAKFSGNPQNNFEWFCDLLFCKEFNRPLGTSGYKNQRHIEHDPIKVGQEIIGWQSKFYDTSLTQHTKELVDLVKGAKKDYPNITRIIIYSNQNWSQGKGQNDPQQKLKIDSEAKTLGVKIDWDHLDNFFGSPFVAIDNELIAKHFFSLDKGFFDLVKDQQAHSENILNEIQTSLIFNGQDIRLDRSIIVDKIVTSQEKVLILSGVGGVGKTAIVKDFFHKINDQSPFYIFKATEFELRSIDEFFVGHSLREFLDGHKNDSNKTVVIDSAEKLLDLKNTDPFKEFLHSLVQENWKIIFTTRDNYLEDLNYAFFEIYKVVPLNINIQSLETKELTKLSETYNFSLPSDENLLELIKIPFYLNEYLRFYIEGEKMDYKGFKEKLWNKIVIKSKPAREQCFLKIASQRAVSGQFFINPDCESDVLDNELKRDGILGYESPHGYFIAHDIYEEWALEKNIEIAFKKKVDTKTFFDDLGESFPIRRAFRKWMSEKLLLQDADTLDFIESAVADKTIESFWQDELLVSILLSSYSDTFFRNFKEPLLNNGFELIKKVSFLLRIACKEVDEDIFVQLGIKTVNLFTLKYVLTKPKGYGWNATIKFVYENLDAIGIENIYFILPLIHDWNSKFKSGEATKYSSLIALQYYQWTIKEDIFFYKDENIKDKLLQTIVYGCSEIKSELDQVLANIVKNKWKKHRDPYYELSKIILTKLDGISVAKLIPERVLQLADLFWSYTRDEGDDFYHSARIEIGQYFNVDDDHFEYFPASAYQTPTYWLLQSDLKRTVDFILNFTNKSVEFFSKTEFAKHEVKEIEVYVDEKSIIKQYTSRDGRLWNMYRGTQVAPHVLESMHMALEKYFLENGKSADSKVLESWLLYLLKNSKSISIPSVVTSIVLAYPEKTFNVAKILFKTKEFFFYDTSRLILDQGHKSSLEALRNSFGVNTKNELHENERLKACDDKHRRWNLEHLFLSYQCFRDAKTSEKEAEERQKVLWDILDNYYEELSPEAEQTDLDETWRLYLARMDKRKMHPTAKKTVEGIEVHWNPEIEPHLKKKSEDSQKEFTEVMKYTSLKLWSSYRMENDKRYEQYKQFESDPKFALEQTKELIKKLEVTGKSKRSPEDFYILNHSIPGEACSVLVRDFSEKISKKDYDFCVQIILKIARLSIKPGYQYDVTDSMRSVISVLPIIFSRYPSHTKEIKEVLLFNLFKGYPIGLTGVGFNAFSIAAIHKLWGNNFKDAQSILIGYLYLKPKYDKSRENVRQESLRKGTYDAQEDVLMRRFVKENKDYLHKIISNEVSLADVEDFEQIDLETLKISFQLIPLKTNDSDHKLIVKRTIVAFAEKLISNDREDKVDYAVRHDFLEKLAYFVLSSSKEETQEYLKPFLDNFNSSEIIADLFQEFISAEDYLNSYEIFWEVWKIFKEKVIDACKNGDGYWYVSKVIKSYLFAQNPWKESAIEWHTFKDSDKRFFKEISGKLGHCPSAFYAISKLLNGIGDMYLENGVQWISNMIDENKSLLTAELEVNTLYYLENLIRKYIYKNRTKIRETQKLKGETILILDFLIARGSVVGYILRENIK